MVTDNGDIVDELFEFRQDSFAVVVAHRSMDNMHHQIQLSQDVDDDYDHKTMVLEASYSFAANDTHRKTRAKHLI